MMKTNDIRESFLSFFESKGHKRLPSDSLIPQNDPTLLFTGAGMNQFKDHFLGLKKDIKRATTSQKCLRTGDLDNVGKTSYHHSFFEMLGNFSFGDYFKEEAILWAWEYLTDKKWLGIPEERLRVSVHEKDSEAFEIWEKKVGIKSDRLVKLGDKSNFWPANAPQDGPNGPCGPCSEIYFDQGANYGPGTEKDTITSDSGRFAEIWNLVFTQFERKGVDQLVPLQNKNIDTGAGLERVACILQGKRSNYEIDIFEPYLKRLREIFIDSSAKDVPSLYRITDHIRAVVFSISDGALPSNEGRGYVIRKLIRRALWHGWMLGSREAFLYTLVPCVLDTMSSQYPELKVHADSTTDTIEAEEDRFLNSLETGLSKLHEELDALRKKGQKILSGEQAFKLYDTFGFPLELTKEISLQSGIAVEENTFETFMEGQRQKARKHSQMAGAIFVKSDLDERLSKLPATRFLGYHEFKAESKVLLAEQIGDEMFVVLDATPFYGESGGQVGDRGHLKGVSFEGDVIDTQKKQDIIIHRLKTWRGELKENDALTAEIDESTRLDIVRHHSATHLLQDALRLILGEQVRQVGSLVSQEKLRFDFSFPRALTNEELAHVEREVIKRILENHTSKVDVTDVQTARERGALAFFGDKYGDQVRLVSLGASQELCGGTHVRATGDIGLFKIISEGSAASGVRRIEAVAGLRAYDLIAQKMSILDSLSNTFKVKPDELTERIQKLTVKVKDLEKGKQSQSQTSGSLMDASWPITQGKVIFRAFKDMSIPPLKEMSDNLKSSEHNTVIVLMTTSEDKASLIVALTDDLVKAGLEAGKLVKTISNLLGGTGGGRKDMAQGGGKIPEDLNSFVELLKKETAKLCK